MNLRISLAFAASLFLCTAAHAQLFRAYLAPTGVDSNPCTLAAPCRLLPAALTAVANGGEIWLLDSANYNGTTVNITKSVTILAVPGVVGSVVAAGGPAISIATPGVKVSLRNLVIVPLPGASGTHGVSVTAPGLLTVERCLIANLPGRGISAEGAVIVRLIDSTVRGNQQGVYLASGPRASVTRSVISDNTQYGFSALEATGAAATTLDVGDSTISGNQFGVYSQASASGGAARISVRDSSIVGGSQGVQAVSTGGQVFVSLAGNIVSNNSIAAVSASGSAARIWAKGNTVADNAYGFYQESGALFESAGNNAVRNNGVDSTGTITPIVEQ